MNTSNTQSEPKVHEIILQQLGGRKFLVMTGSKNLLYGKENNFLSMHLTRNKLGAQYLRITLTPMDVYKMEFSKTVRKYETIPGTNKKFCVDEKLVIIKTIEPVYDDMLQELFTQETGLYTHL